MAIFSIPEARKIERARLSNLFERLSARLPQTGVPFEVTKDISRKGPTPPMPDEFSTTGVLRNLSAIRTSGTSEVRYPQMRCNTVASTSSSIRSSSRDATPSQGGKDDKGRFGEFPLAEEMKYSFTFKHMIHKLYKKDDWLRTVKEVLEKSKRDFKPLAECGLKQDCIDHHGSGVKCKDVPPSRFAKRASSTAKGRDSRRMSLAARHEVDQPPADGESLRALKKRCVGIRKSTSRSRNQDVSNETRESGKRGIFVFASTISSRECPGKEIYLQFPSPQVSPSDSCFSVAGQDTTTPHSPVSPITPSSPISLHTTGCAIGMKGRIGVNYPIVMLGAAPRSRLTKRNLNGFSPRFSLKTTEDVD